MTLSAYSFGSQQQNQPFKMENISVENIPNNKGFAFIWDLKIRNNTEAWMRINVCTMCAWANFLVWNHLPRVFFTSKAMIGGITVAKIWILLGSIQAVYEYGLLTCRLSSKSPCPRSDEDWWRWLVSPVGPQMWPGILSLHSGQLGYCCPISQVLPYWGGGKT